MSEAQKKQVHSEERKKKIGLSKKGNTYRRGLHLTDETKEKLRNANLGKKLSEETKFKISESNKGKTKGRIISAYQKQRISESLRGRKISKETLLKRRLSVLGQKRKPHSLETKKKISESRKRTNMILNKHKKVA